MKLATFLAEARERVGVVDVDREIVRDVTELPPAGGGLLAAIETWDEARPALESAARSELPLT